MSPILIWGLAKIAYLRLTCPFKSVCGKDEWEEGGKPVIFVYGTITIV